MQSQNPANHILIDRSSESQIDLFCDPRTSPCWIALLHIDNCPDQIRRWTLWSGLGESLWRKQQTILLLNQRTMEFQERRWLESNCNRAKPRPRATRVRALPEWRHCHKCPN